MSTQTALILALARNERNLDLLTGLLREMDHTVQTATSVDDFDRLIDEYSDPAIAVLDIDGFTETVWQQCERLQERNVPVLALTGSPPETHRAAAFRHGAQTVMDKPVRKAELTASIRALLEGHTES